VETVPYGAGAGLGGTLTLPDGVDPSGATIELRQLEGLKPERVLTTTTVDSAGNWLAQLPPLPANAVVRAVFAGDSARPGVVSPPVYLTLAPQIELSVSPPAPVAGDTVVAAGAVRPGKTRVTVTAYLERPDGSERRVASRTARASSGSYRAKLKLTTAGQYRIVTTAGADSRSGAGSSPPVAVTVSSPQ
jgi:hypothetical protein